ncbi:phosphotransferase [Planotetraspora phitsanulokensis]|uniref:Trifolitoxin immunity protein n=1 Tax=Planotetraspora phitsanulokensis TaxID=575192 RepID=A0A8J3U6F6_9ACTN|nr:aminoglycoside phosphotransferase family protein [Planotetraspora phitsanulokensis]GII39473.1 trifolitoxin immunity protein [Planotetraspora phitsanulokensis]
MTDQNHDVGRHDEQPLIGDGVTQAIVRVGDTVRRPARPFTTTVHAYLAHLHTAGFSDAPIPLGFDDQGREVLTFVPGDVPREPLPPHTSGEEVLIALARLVRRLHDAADGWVPPADAQWGGTPGALNRDSTPDGEPLLVGHRDYCPGNVVFRDGLPAALIDFDLAKPTTRIDDLANALYYWGPLLHPKDRAPSFVGLDIPHRVALFADAYGMTSSQRRALVPAAAAMIHRFHVNMSAAAAIDPIFKRMWDEGVKDRLPRAEAWLRDHGPAIAAGL